MIGGPAVGRLVEDVGPPPVLPPPLVPVPTPTPSRARVQVPFLRRLLESTADQVPDNSAAQDAHVEQAEVPNGGAGQAEGTRQDQPDAQGAEHEQVRKLCNRS